MYYNLFRSLNKKDTGVDNKQSVLYKSVVPIDDDNSIFNRFNKVENIENIDCPKPILQKGAILTDLISTSYAANLLFISDKLKKILFTRPNDGIQSFPTSVICVDKQIHSFWIVQPFDFKFEYIDFHKSTICKTYNGRDADSIEIENAEQFKYIIDNLEWPNSIGIKRLFLLPNIPTDFFSLRFVDSGIGYYVSDRLKSQIETEQCTGLGFIPEGMTVYEFMEEEFKRTTFDTTATDKQSNTKVGLAGIELILSKEQFKWIAQKQHKKEIPFILENWNEEKHYEPEKAATALRIAIDAWRLGFLDTWNKEIIDAILEKQFDKDELAHADAFKEHLQLQILLARREFKKESYFRSILRALLDTLVNGFELNMLQPLDGEKIYDSADKHIYIFKKHWPEGSLVKLSKHDGDELPDSVVMVIGE